MLTDIYNAYMTLRLRNILLIILAVVSAAGPAIILYGLVAGRLILNSQSLLEIIPTAILTLFVTIVCIIIFISFRNTVSFEIFFYYIFIFSFLFDIFKLTDLLIQPNSVLNVYVMLPTRLVYYGKFMGTLALLSAGLFATGMEYQRMEIASLIAFILPAVLVLVLPVDSTSTVPGGTLEIGSFYEISIIISILCLISVLNFIIAGLKNENREYFIIAGSVFIAVCGREIIFYLQRPIFQGLGFILLLSGTIIFGRRTHRLYQWD